MKNCKKSCSSGIYETRHYNGSCLLLGKRKLRSFATSYE